MITSTIPLPPSGKQYFGNTTMTSLKRVAIKAISSLALVILVLPCHAGHFTKETQPEFQQGFFENGRQAYMSNWNEMEVRLDPDVPSLLIGNELFNLTSKEFPGLDEADFSEAEIYKLRDDKSYLCFDFGFGGLFRSGSFQKFRGLILVHKNAAEKSTLFYLTGEGVGCERLNYGRAESPSSTDHSSGIQKH